MTATTPDTATVWRTLSTILDPEFGISIVDLGLIYSVACTDGNVSVVMTLTTPTCPSGAWIQGGVDAALRQLPGIQAVQVELTFEPPWNTTMLTEEARQALGWAKDEA